MGQPAGGGFGALLRRLRTERRLSQEALAERAGLSTRAVSDLERGVNARPRQATADLLADALGLVQEHREDFLGAALGSTHSAVPFPATPLVGRDDDLARLSALLADPEVRLVTLLGPGGVGKTRLLLAAAAHDRRPVSYVALEAVGDASLVLPAVARELGLADAATAVGRRLAGRIGNEPRLLVLDGLDRVCAVGEELADLLAACPNLAVITSSRLPLRVRAEVRFAVAPLPVPPPEATRPEAYAAVELFLRRVWAIDADWPLDDPGRIAALCRRLDGLPLAIELAAARCAAVPVSALLAADPLDLLSDGAVDTPERHRSLRATLAWSVSLLDPVARGLLHRLAAFAGSAALDAVRAVHAPEDPVPALARLVELSLVRRDGDRYVLLSSVQAYAEQDARALGGWDDAVARHTTWLRDWLPATTTALAGPGERAVLDRIEADHDNVRLALDRAVEPTAVLRIAAGAWRFWQARGYLVEGARRLTAAVALGAEQADGLRAPLLTALGIFARDLDDPGTALHWLAAAADAHARDGNRLGVAQARNNVGNVLCDLERYPEALAAYDDVTHELAGQPPDERMWIVAGINRGVALGCLGRRREAIAALRAAAEAAHAQGRGSDLAAALSNLARVVAEAGHPRVAVRLELQAVARRAELGDERGLAYSFELLARAATSCEATETGLLLLGAAQVIRERHGEPARPMHRALNHATRAAGRAVLGTPSARGVEASGRTLTVTQALALAQTLEPADLVASGRAASRA